MIYFLFFKILLLILHWRDVFVEQQSGWRDIFYSLFSGVVFDSVVSAYILAVPLLLLAIYAQTRSEILKKIALYWMSAGYTFAFLFSAAHVVYYGKFYQFITVHDLHWFKNFPTVFKMIITEPHYWFVVVPFLFLMWFFYRRIRVIVTNFVSGFKPLKKQMGVFILTFLFLVLAMRGRLTGRPLEMFNAFDMHNVFLNDLKITPAFAFEKSLEDWFREKSNCPHWMEDKEAIGEVQKYLQIEKPYNRSPVSRFEKGDSLTVKKNVVVILMESMAAWKMRYFGNEENRTPFLDSLFLQSISFSRLYSNGIHTFAGIYGTLFGYPMIFEQHPFIRSKPLQYYSMPRVFHDLGYRTVFFIPHNAEFDNLGYALKSNGFDRLYFEEDYPRDSVRNVWGVDDHFLLDFALEKMDELAAGGQPFFVTILTVSDHRPYYIPDWVQGDSDDIRATRFADWSLAEFMRKARTKPWFDRTVFLFVADHGKTHRMVYKVPLTHNHIPALIYYKGVKPQIIDKPSKQTDLFPTLMHVLGYAYLNNTFGIDLLRYEQPFAFFNHDSRYGVINKEYLLIFDREKISGLYHYPDHDLTDYSERYPQLRDSMERYAKAYIQTAHYMLKHDLQRLGPEQRNSGRTD